MRLVKYLAHAGAASRRAAEGMIAAGRVTLGGEVVTDPARDVGEGDRVTLDGRELAGPEPRVAFVLNKPVGVLSTAQDTHGRRTVVELVPRAGLRLYPVGRLDADSSGLILLTNDGELANRLTHPSFEVPKTYRARLEAGPIDDRALAAAARGRRAGGRPDRTGARAARGPPHDRADDPRGPQPAGAADVQRRRVPGRRRCADRLRPAASGRPRARVRTGA